MATLVNDRDASLVAPRLIATSVAISGDGALFFKNVTNVVVPTNITLTAVPTVFTSPSYAWSYAINTSPSTWTSMGGTTNTQVINGSAFSTLIGLATSIKYKVVVTQSGFLSATNTFDIDYAIEAGTGVDGLDAYNIRLDNESRIAEYEYNDVPKTGTFPMTVQTYVTVGASDITVSTAYVTYSINSYSGTTGHSINSTGLITVTGITTNNNYVEIKAHIAEPGKPALDAYKKLYIYKIKDLAVGGDLTVTADHEYFSYTNSSSTTNIAAWSTVTATASLAGISGIVDWEAKAYDISGNELSPGGAALFSYSGNTLTMSDAQFGARGNPSTKQVVVRATYNTGSGLLADSVIIYRDEGGNGYKLYVEKDLNQNYDWSFTENANLQLTTLELASEASTLNVIKLSDLSVVTSGWVFTASVPDAGATVDISGTGSGPYTASGSADTIIKLLTPPTTYDNSGTTNYKIYVTATKSSYPTVVAIITYSIRSPGSDGLSIICEPSPIVLPVSSNGTILNYTNTFTSLKIFKNSKDITQTDSGWTITKVDGPGITAVIEAP